METSAYVGGGSLPESAMPSIAVALEPQSGADAAAQSLRRAPTPIVGRIDEGRLLLDLRTIFPADDGRVIAALQSL
jgi:L-seryl-tRNA(Ser) seleniumtransferase